MNIDQPDIVLRKFCGRRPFQPFTVEFTSGFQGSVKHPEAIRRFGEIYVFRAVSGEYCMFAAEGVVRLFEVIVPAPTA